MKYLAIFPFLFFSLNVFAMQTKEYSLILPGTESNAAQKERERRIFEIRELRRLEKEMREQEEEEQKRAELKKKAEEEELARKAAQALAEQKKSEKRTMCLAEAARGNRLCGCSEFIGKSKSTGAKTCTQ